MRSWVGDVRGREWEWVAYVLWYSLNGKRGAAGARREGGTGSAKDCASQIDLTRQVASRVIITGGSATGAERGSGQAVIVRNGRSQQGEDTATRVLS